MHEDEEGKKKPVHVESSPKKGKELNTIRSCGEKKNKCTARQGAIPKRKSPRKKKGEGDDAYVIKEDKGTSGDSCARPFTLRKEHTKTKE
ncbi:hypothetical protein KI387_013531, partial [Taxus chinensis]